MHIFQLYNELRANYSVALMGDSRTKGQTLS